jgi:hypothetical protein
MQARSLMFVGLATLTIVASWAPAAAAKAYSARAARWPICSIREVHPHGDGVVISFGNFRGLHMQTAEDRPAAIQIGADGRLRARLGQRLTARRTVEDKCTMDIVSVGGRIGVRAEEFSFWAKRRPGSDPTSDPHVRKQFIPAR